MKDDFSSERHLRILGYREDARNRSPANRGDKAKDSSLEFQHLRQQAILGGEA
ncbi:hypothetical protein [Rhizobium sp. WYCCWR 11146]|uniref:hypothetical protein n=1 Tax=Rhizobium sp. WYCCWR 11146 TaxID=2749833 RepID=UPI0015E73DAE|nr:hypothetical protein [Rhizobium sp. WYCCWR 11146]MBA1349726.1 hypothetical protein [Rhizobium sp. WYCCWR 11146]